MGARSLPQTPLQTANRPPRGLSAFVHAKSPRWERLAFPKSLATRISPGGGFLGRGAQPVGGPRRGNAGGSVPGGAGAGPGGRMNAGADV